ncbi:MAG: sigma-54 dependent transcriptional regulator, partial [Anaerolineae bacterium]|nr:sigma-54 dependent transcriptional regulator [Anaerolineae bacterium]
PLIVITGHATVERAVRLLQGGASDYLVKPFDLTALVERARVLARQGYEADVPPLGISPAMKAIERSLRAIAARATTVLITGESGTGKEVVCRRLHQLAHGSADAPFVAVNCGAIAESLAESAFFGHERGAFTGADRNHKGFFEQADGGTLFLDELAELSPAMQVKLLRVLEERSVRRLGGERQMPVRFRLVCATLRPLDQMVREGRFREDLYYRVNVVRVQLPPLRDRPEDVYWLAQQCLSRQPWVDGQCRRFAPGARAALLAYPWPGNVRELVNRIERASVLAVGPVITHADLFSDGVPSPASGEPDVAPSLAQVLEESEREYLRWMLDRHQGRVGDTARALGISRKSLWERCRRLGIRSEAVAINEA